MPARLEEVHHAREEGIEFLMLMNPLEFVGNEQQWLTGAKMPQDGTWRTR